MAGSRNQAEFLEIGHRTGHGLAANAQHLRELFVSKLVREVQPVAACFRFCYKVQELCAEPNEYGLREEGLKFAMRGREAAAQCSQQLHQRVGPSSNLLDQEICRDFENLGPIDSCGVALLNSTTEAELAKDLT